MRPVIPRKKVLLIVDDDSYILASLEPLLAQEMPHVRILTAGSGAQGMIIAAKEPLDMILSDFRMPSMDGVEFLRRARLAQADIPMVIMSADASPELGAQALRLAGVKLIVAKPFNLAKLMEMLKSVFPNVVPNAAPLAAVPSPGDDLAAVAV